MSKQFLDAFHNTFIAPLQAVKIDVHWYSKLVSGENSTPFKVKVCPNREGRITVGMILYAIKAKQARHPEISFMIGFANVVGIFKPDFTGFLPYSTEFMATSPPPTPLYFAVRPAKPNDARATGFNILVQRNLPGEIPELFTVREDENFGGLATEIVKRWFNTIKNVRVLRSNTPPPAVSSSSSDAYYHLFDLVACRAQDARVNPIFYDADNEEAPIQYFRLVAGPLSVPASVGYNALK